MQEDECGGVREYVRGCRYWQSDITYIIGYITTMTTTLRFMHMYFDK